MKETRKIQITGGSTYIVSLPSDWVRGSGLGKGSEVFLSTRGIALQIIPVEERSAEVSKELRVSRGADLTEVQRALTSFYISNFDTFTIRSNEYIDQDLRDTISRFARTVMGVEVIEETSNAIVLQNVLKSNTFPVESAARRMMLMVDTMIADTLKAIVPRDADLLNNIILRDDEVDRYQWYIYRESRTISHDNMDNVFFLILSRILERIADHAVNLCKVFLQGTSIREPQAEALREFMKVVQEMLLESVRCFFSKDFHAMNALIEKKLDISDIRDELLRKSGGGKDAGLVSLGVEEISRIGFYATDVAELAMDRITARSESISL